MSEISMEYLVSYVASSRDVGDLKAYVVDNL